MNRDTRVSIGIGSFVVALLCLIFVFPLPPAVNFFEGAGRVIVVCGAGALVIWVLEKDSYPEGRMPVSEVAAAAGLSGFFGTIAAAILDSLLELFRG